MPNPSVVPSPADGIATLRSFQPLMGFEVRKPRFQKLRRMIGARKTAIVLRTGATAALVYGQGNTGVSCSMLQSQRSAVAAASVHGGSGELGLPLFIADGSMCDKVDPAFAAHEMPIAKWAEVSGKNGSPGRHRKVSNAVTSLAKRPSPWAMVKGPAGAFVATVWRLKWTVLSCLAVTDGLCQHIDFCGNSPAMVERFVQQSVWHWRWRRVGSAIRT